MVFRLGFGDFLVSIPGSGLLELIVSSALLQGQLAHVGQESLCEGGQGSLEFEIFMRFILISTLSPFSSQFGRQDLSALKSQEKTFIKREQSDEVV